MTGIKKVTTVIMVAVLCMACFAGCKKGADTKVVLTTGFARNEIFRIEDISCTTPEIMVYLTNIQNRYEAVYGESIWDTQIDGVTLEENVKETALARIAQTKAMTLLAKKHQVELDDSEKQLVKEAADAYYESLNDTEITQMGISEDTIHSLYEEYALSDKLYHYLIKDINPEISDDEARTITVQHILIKTYSLDENGNKIEHTEYAKELSRQKANEIWQMANEGQDFEELAMEYSEDENITYSFGKGEMQKNLEEAGFGLGKGEISGVVETDFGYHIMKCISTFNKEATDANKIKIVEQRKEEAFGKEYDDFVKTLTKNLNKELWATISFIHDDNVVTSDFFEVYDEYFKNVFQG